MTMMAIAGVIVLAFLAWLAMKVVGWVLRLGLYVTVLVIGYWLLAQALHLPLPAWMLGWG